MKDKAKKTTNTKDTGKIFDVTRPGKAAVPATSRPVIVGHKPQVKDPMMAKHDNEEQTLLDSKQKVAVQPSAGAEKPVEAAEHVSPAGAPPVPAELETEVAASSVRDAGTSQPDEIDAPTIASVAVTGAVEKPAPGSTAPELDPELADMLSDDASAAVEPPQNAPAAAREPQESPDYERPPQPEPETAPSPAPAMSGPVPEKSNGTVGVVFEEPANVRQPREMPEGIDPLPVLPDEPTPQAIIVAHHSPKASAGKVFLIILLVLIFATIVLDVLLDAGFIVLNGIPHTDFL